MGLFPLKILPHTSPYPKKLLMMKYYTWFFETWMLCTVVDSIKNIDSERFT